MGAQTHRAVQQPGELLIIPSPPRSTFTLRTDNTKRQVLTALAPHFYAAVRNAGFLNPIRRRTDILWSSSGVKWKWERSEMKIKSVEWEVKRRGKKAHYKNIMGQRMLFAALLFMCSVAHGCPTSTFSSRCTEWILHSALEFILDCEHPVSGMLFMALLLAFVCLHSIICMQKTQQIIFRRFTDVSVNKMWSYRLSWRRKWNHFLCCLSFSVLIYCCGCVNFPLQSSFLNHVLGFKIVHFSYLHFFSWYRLFNSFPFLSSPLFFYPSVPTLHLSLPPSSSYLWQKR